VRALFATIAAAALLSAPTGCKKDEDADETEEEAEEDDGDGEEEAKEESEPEASAPSEDPPAPTPAPIVTSTTPRPLPTTTNRVVSGTSPFEKANVDAGVAAPQPTTKPTSGAPVAPFQPRGATTPTK
jgi:hypothetical protein